MGKTLIAVLALAVGLVVGGLGGAALGIGGGAGIGIATGLSAGACGIAQAAQEEGLMTAEQVDQVFNRALGNLRALTPEAETSAEPMVGSAADCDAVLARLREAAAR